MTTINNNLKITWARRQEIKQIARDTLKKYNITAPPAKPKKILMGIGELYRFSDPEEKGFTRYKDGKYSIYINDVEYKHAAAWTYAHELGHIVLDHFHLGYGYLTSEFDCKLLDEEADIFAAEYLMQEDWIKRYSDLFPPSKAKNLGKLKDLFKVSWTSLFNRLDSLRIQSKKLSQKILETNKKVQYAALSSEFIHEPDDVYVEYCHSKYDSYIAPPEDDAELNKCMFCGSELPWDSKSFCPECGTLLIKSHISYQAPKPVKREPLKRKVSLISKVNALERYEDETYYTNKETLLSLEEAFLSPDDCRPRSYDYNGWCGYDD